MTIRRSINASELNGHLSNIEQCAEYAPAGTYIIAREVTDLVADLSNSLLAGVRDLGLKAPNQDQLREVEAIVYGYIRDANPTALATAEGFGEHINGPAGGRIIEQTIRDRDALRSLGAV